MTIQEIYLIITALVALTVAFVKVQVATSSNTKNQAEFKTEMNAKTDKLDDELNNKVDKLEKRSIIHNWKWLKSNQILSIRVRASRS